MAPIRLVSLKTGAERPLSATETFEKLLNRGQAVFSDDGRMLATSSTTGRIRLWSVPDGQLLRTLTSSRFPSTDPTYGVEGIGFDASGERLVAVDQSGVRVWDVRRGVPIALLGGPYAFKTETVRFLPGGDFVVGFSPALETTIPGMFTLWTTALEKRSPGKIEQLVAMISADVRAGIDVSLRMKLQHQSSIKLHTQQ